MNPASEPNKCTIRVMGAIPPELWNRFGTKILPKLRTGDRLAIGIDFNVTIRADFSGRLKAELQQIIEDLGLIKEAHLYGGSGPVFCFPDVFLTLNLRNLVFNPSGALLCRVQALSSFRAVDPQAGRESFGIQAPWQRDGRYNAASSSCSSMHIQSPCARCL